LEAEGAAVEARVLIAWRIGFSEVDALDGTAGDFPIVITWSRLLVATSGVAQGDVVL
jgi:hypothetical protein